MSVLRQAGLVKSRKDGRWIHYRLPGDDARQPFARPWSLSAKTGKAQKPLPRTGNAWRRTS